MNKSSAQSLIFLFRSQIETFIWLDYDEKIFVLGSLTDKALDRQWRGCGFVFHLSKSFSSL